MDEGSIAQMYFDGAGQSTTAFRLDTPVKDLPKKAVDVVLYGTKGEKLDLHCEKSRAAAATIRSLLRASSTTWSAATSETTSESDA